MTEQNPPSEGRVLSRLADTSPNASILRAVIDAGESDEAPLKERIMREIAHAGPLPFSRFMTLALYDDQSGFYSDGGQAGRRHGHFITSVETGPLFGALVAKRLDELWDQHGQPDVFTVAEVGAGVGTLYRTVRRAAPRCLHALRYTLVEQSANLRSAHRELPGDQWLSVDQLPHAQQHLIVANELLDNLAFDIVERQGNEWIELRVSVDQTEPGKLCLTPSAAPADETQEQLSRLLPHASPGVAVPVMSAARAWLRAAQSCAPHGLLFDYAATTSELADRQREGWLRTYRDQQRGNDPFDQPGSWDITTDVAWDQLGDGLTVTSQAAWLQAQGIEDLVAQAKNVWAERASTGDLAAMIARSAVSEAEALTDPNGLGGFLVIEWGHWGE